MGSIYSFHIIVTMGSQLRWACGLSLRFYSVVLLLACLISLVSLSFVNAAIAKKADRTAYDEQDRCRTEPPTCATMHSVTNGQTDRQTDRQTCLSCLLHKVFGGLV